YAGRIIRDRQWCRVVVVTDAFHLPRALYMFRRLGLRVAGEGVPRPAQVTRIWWTWALSGERIRLIRSACLFAIGAHKPLLDKIWGESIIMP
ncbi:MAG: ElyC/SanA/YdcF family protein, partial [Candidatus Binatia bacterium]